MLVGTDVIDDVDVLQPFIEEAAVNSPHCKYLVGGHQTPMSHDQDGGGGGGVSASFSSQLSATQNKAEMNCRATRSPLLLHSEVFYDADHRRQKVIDKIG